MFYNQLLEIIEEETLRNINMYSEFLGNASDTVTIEYMRRYISDKIYDTPVGPLTFPDSIVYGHRLR